jgi:hypothetical protein
MHPKTDAVVFETITENMMDHVDTLTPYDENGYTIIITKVEEAA